jgi:diguanylate cyclase (GGDEF)-like protein
MTEAMINGVIDKRESFLVRLQEIKGLRSARVIRGPEVVKQFGAGLGREQGLDAIEAQVIATGEAYFAVDESTLDAEAPIYRATIPYKADAHGNPNCMTCHQVEQGAVLGAVTLTISIRHLRQQALLTIALMLVPVAIFAVVLVLMFRRQIRPLSRTAQDLQATVEGALKGQFDGRIEARTRDEIGQISGEVNQLMVFLDGGLGEIREDVAQLIRCHPTGLNKLENTRAMVSRLIDAAHFKQSIEEDETRDEVYRRLAQVIQDDFGVRRYSIYEVANSKNRMTPVIVDGTSGGDCRWCDPQILIRAETCRARRTGHLIDAVDTPGICNAFRADGQAGGEVHICLPVIQSGSVGSVVQLVFPASDSARVQEAVPFLQVYLREAAPVIEAKRLMDTLRESNLHDPMTGLKNRRFLEEYIDTVVAGTQRRKQQISLLMLDLDYFKKVNDTHGHDAGDAILKALAAVLRQQVRAADLVIRFGGEEFLVILQDTELGDGDEVGEKIRAAVEATKFQVPGGVLQKTISIGVADFPADSDTFWQAMKYADVALYRAKEEGRNRVLHFRPEMWDQAGEY